MEHAYNHLPLIELLRLAELEENKDRPLALALAKKFWELGEPIEDYLKDIVDEIDFGTIFEEAKDTIIKKFKTLKPNEEETILEELFEELEEKIAEELNKKIKLNFLEILKEN